jgi:hypothetical protein
LYGGYGKVSSRYANTTRKIRICNFLIELSVTSSYKSPTSLACLLVLNPDGNRPLRCSEAYPAPAGGEAQKRRMSPTPWVRPMFISFRAAKRTPKQGYGVSECE